MGIITGIVPVSCCVPLIRCSPPCVVNTGENRVNKPSDQAQALPPLLPAPPAHHHPHQNSWGVELYQKVSIIRLVGMGKQQMACWWWWWCRRWCRQRSRPLQTKGSIVLLDGSGNLGNVDDERKLKELGIYREDLCRLVHSVAYRTTVPFVGSAVAHAVYQLISSQMRNNFHIKRLQPLLDSVAIGMLLRDG
ncbi:hypothetical protein D8674_007100 [Pyrus ussuriensis x Pyrus communis]|uniref:Uncharacterized protein n=1 Tax=Pyrus ussuriensis x Pyrus communis TaxID=2448454 RepID=A0A5N5FWD9_9ROSA|nr:hypothetical protein D8674_007100 [Pyrus ussuriensis x Pyrus communis]